MKAYFADPGSSQGIALRDVPTPEPKAGEIVVSVRATALNRYDVEFSKGHIDPRLPKDTPVPLGLECAGEVAIVGPGVTRWRIGDRVMGRCWGSFAEYGVMKQGLAMEMPAELSWEEAATMHVLVIAHDAIVTNGELRAGEAILVNAASSGIGMASLQMARLFKAGIIIGTTRAMNKVDRVAEAGLEDVQLIAADGFAEKIMDLTKGLGVNVVSDSVGGPVLHDTMRCMALLGRLVSIGRLGATVAQLDMDLLALRRLRLIGVTNRTRTLAEQEAMVDRFAITVIPALREQRLHPVIDRVFPFDRTAEALAVLAEGAQVGKIVLRL